MKINSKNFRDFFFRRRFQITLNFNFEFPFDNVLYANYLHTSRVPVMFTYE